MNQKDLQELKEITGLVSQSELSIASVCSSAACNNGLGQYIGMFVKVGCHYGMIDDIHGDRLGFVWSDKDSWTGELVRPKYVEKCVADNDIKKAEKSARVYFEREVASLRARIKRGYEFDNQKMLRERIDLYESWLKWLG